MEAVLPWLVLSLKIDIIFFEKKERMSESWHKEPQVHTLNFVNVSYPMTNETQWWHMMMAWH